MSGSRVCPSSEGQLQVLLRGLWHETRCQVSLFISLLKTTLRRHATASESDWLHPPSSRIYEILPQRIQQWQQSPCVAEEMGRRQLERIRKEQQAARLRLTLMEKRFHELEAIIANAKQQQVQQHEEVGDGGPERQWFTRLSVCLTEPSVSLSRWLKATAMTLTCRSSAYPAAIRSTPRWRCGTWRDATLRSASGGNRKFAEQLIPTL